MTINSSSTSLHSNKNMDTKILWKSCEGEPTIILGKFHPCYRSQDEVLLWCKPTGCDIAGGYCTVSHPYFALNFETCCQITCSTLIDQSGILVMWGWGGEQLCFCEIPLDFFICVHFVKYQDLLSLNWLSPGHYTVTYIVTCICCRRLMSSKQTWKSLVVNTRN